MCGIAGRLGCRTVVNGEESMLASALCYKLLFFPLVCGLAKMSVVVNMAGICG